MADKIIGVAVAATLLLPLLVELWIRREDGHCGGLVYEMVLAVGLAIVGLFGVVSVVFSN